MTPMRVVYLTGPTVYLRAMVSGDKEHGAAWFDGAFPINAARAETILKEEQKDRPMRYAILRLEGDEIVGSARVASHDRLRTCELTFHMAPWLPDAGALRAEALRLLVPWLRDQVEVMVVEAPIAADEHEMIEAAGALGMVLSVRLREFLARPGGRVDQLIYQALNPRWEVRDA